jgi:hypothetical protein
VDQAVLAKQDSLETKKVEKVQKANAVLDLANDALRIAKEDVAKTEAAVTEEARQAGSVINTILSHVQQAIFTRCARTLEALFHDQGKSEIPLVVHHMADHKAASQMQVLMFSASRPVEAINTARRLPKLLADLKAQAEAEGLTA